MPDRRAAGAGGNPWSIPADGYRATDASRRSAHLEQLGDLRRPQLIDVVGHLALPGQQAKPSARGERKPLDFVQQVSPAP
jgi:hypothetical protein